MSKPPATALIAAAVAAVALLCAGRTAAGALTWTGSVSGAWNTSAANWSGTATVYADGTPGDAVNFIGGANRSITIGGTYSPASMGFNNASGADFSFTSGGIGGAGALSKAGAGDAIFDSTTSFAGYSGAIGVTGGRLLRQQNSGTGSFGSNTITLDGGTLGVKYTAGWQGTTTVANPITVTNAGGTLIGVYNDGNYASYTGAITMNSGSTLKLDASGANGNAYDLTLGAVTLGGTVSITRLHTDYCNSQYYDGRRRIFLSGAVNGAGQTLTLDGVNTWVRSAGSITVGNLNVAKELWFEDRATTGSSFVTLDSGGKLTVQDNGLLVLAKGTLDASTLVLNSGATIQLKPSNWSSTATITNPLTIATTRTLLVGMMGGNDGITLAGGATIESGGRLLVGPADRSRTQGQRGATFGGAVRFLGGSAIEGNLIRANGTAVLGTHTIILGDTNAGTAETVTIKGQGAGVMAFSDSSVTDIGGLTLRYEAATNTSPFKFGWGATGWNGGTGALTAAVLGGSAGTEFAPQVGTGDNGKIIAIGTTASTVFTASKPTTVVTAGTVEFRNSASSGSDTWLAGALGPVVIASGGSLNTAVSGATVSASAITVNAGGTLSGAGTINAPVTLVGGTLTPGNSAGTLSIGGSLALDSATTLPYELGTWDVNPGGASDFISVAGALTLDGTLNVTALTGFGPGANPWVDYKLMGYNSLASDLGLNLGSMPAGNQYRIWTTTGVGGGPGFVMLQVPEPGALALLALGSAVCLRRQRQR